MELDAPPIISVKSLEKSFVKFARFTSDRIHKEVIAPPPANSYLLTLQLRSIPALNVWLEGKHFRKAEAGVGDFTVFDQNVGTLVEMNMAFDTVDMLFSQDALTEIAREQGGGAVASLSREGLLQANDPVIQNLAHCLLPAFEHPESASRLFLEHVALAALTHITGKYSDVSLATSVRGGLAPWQIRRAKELLASRLDGDITLEALARECGLSRSHFSRAFKRSTGRSPHRWMMEQRLERACAMMASSNASLAEVAEACGFSDQSHFSRCFASSFGTPPSRWRRTVHS
jgi:AraC-like DNA-binding protein